MEAAPDKQHAHELIERLQASQISTAVRFLESMLLDPVARAVATAPPDDEPVTEDDRRCYHDGQAWFRSKRLLKDAVAATGRRRKRLRHNGGARWGRHSACRGLFQQAPKPKFSKTFCSP